MTNGVKTYAPEEAARLEAMEAQRHEHRGIVFFTGHQYVYGCREGRVSYWMQSFCPFTGLPKGRISGGSFYDEVHGDAHAVCAAYARILIDQVRD